VAAALFDELEMEERRAQQPARADDCDCGAEAWRSFGKFNRLYVTPPPFARTKP